jgi:hypothetical protein
VAFPHEGEETVDGWCIDEGLSVDVPEKAVWLWDSCEVDPRWLERISGAWPGWRVDGHIDGVVRQAQLSGRDPAPYMLADAEVARQLVTTLCADSSIDFSALLKTVVSDMPEGSDRVEVAHGFFRVDPPPLHPTERRARLEQLLQDKLV